VLNSYVVERTIICFPYLYVKFFFCIETAAIAIMTSFRYYGNSFNDSVIHPISSKSLFQSLF
jgi:hypothetical protein